MDGVHKNQQDWREQIISMWRFTHFKEQLTTEIIDMIDIEVQNYFKILKYNV